jgi:hypothetical protein
MDDLGSAVAISGTTALIGADGVNQGSGAAYVFVRSGTRWVLQATLADPGNRPGDYFGSAVAVEGTTVMIGAYGSDGAGQVWPDWRNRRSWRES